MEETKEIVVELDPKYIEFLSNFFNAKLLMSDEHKVVKKIDDTYYVGLFGIFLTKKDRKILEKLPNLYIDDYEQTNIAVSGSLNEVSKVFEVLNIPISALLQSSS